ncbi:hypothetical protein J437_LFUL007855 [Ladona fulva]|uniref:LITAF domain-containing protein n=1 Tax=Ladona fulva TaxID=123851 RepID=A0A8K0P1G8_LADFU|nr:hypothetical protein J437_LFUL007855 [Ladona fulva]
MTSEFMLACVRTIYDQWGGAAHMQRQYMEKFSPCRSYRMIYLRKIKIVHSECGYCCPHFGEPDKITGRRRNLLLFSKFSYEKSGPPPQNLPPLEGVNPPPPSYDAATAASPPATQAPIYQGPGAALGPTPVNMVCPSCHANITSKLSPVNSTKTHMIALVMCLCGLWPCCLIPYCVDTCRNSNHNCPVCNAYLGQYKR